MKNNQVNTIETTMNKLEALNNESSKNIIGGRVKVSVRVIVV
jgi:hypothetical protein